MFINYLIKILLLDSECEHTRMVIVYIFVLLRFNLGGIGLFCLLMLNLIKVKHSMLRGKSLPNA